MAEDQRDVLIERFRDHQIETVTSTGNYTKYRIIWLNPCTYRLFMLEGPEPVVEAWGTSYLEVMILEGDKNGYKYKSLSSATGRSEIGYVNKI